MNIKKTLYVIITSIIFSAGMYTSYAEYKNGNIAKANLSLMNKKHLFASVISTENVLETTIKEQVVAPVKKESKKITKDTKKKTANKIVDKNNAKKAVTTKKKR